MIEKCYTLYSELAYTISGVNQEVIFLPWGLQAHTSGHVCIFCGRIKSLMMINHYKALQHTKKGDAH